MLPGRRTADDLNVVVIGWGGVASVTGVADTAGNTYLPAGGTFGTSSGVNSAVFSQEIFYAINTKAGAAASNTRSPLLSYYVEMPRPPIFESPNTAACPQPFRSKLLRRRQLRQRWQRQR